MRVTNLVFLNIRNLKNRYLSNPHLINELKYDLRIYVLVSSYDPLRIYIFEEGLTRFATEKYSTSMKELSKRYVHLTNYSVNKHA
jgi:tubulin polyglutamylase TTLL4